MDLTQYFSSALRWIDEYTVNGGIADTYINARPYPEVSGYCIPSLWRWGEKERARAYGAWLLSVQHPEGAWTDAGGKLCCMFDTGQVLRGLLVLREEGHMYDSAVERAGAWLASRIMDGGCPEPPERELWGEAVPDSVIVYALEPLSKAAKICGMADWRIKAEACLHYFSKSAATIEFTHLSHFHAYVLEAFCDLGRADLAAQGMERVAALQAADGSVPGLPGESWVCSTGLFQYAIVWYKLGDVERANRAFEYALSLQNSSGGWFGSYERNKFFSFLEKAGLRKKPFYFPEAEISWAVKFFLDAFSLKLHAEFEKMAPIFLESIGKDDGRYLCVKECVAAEQPLRVLDAGCGKGRYLKNLVADFPSLELHGMDISAAVMHNIDVGIFTHIGTLANAPFENAFFDMVYTAEALEHAVNIPGALRELLRILKPGGTLIVIDKNIDKLGQLELAPWEQWFGLETLKDQLRALGCDVEIVSSVMYEGRNDGLFAAWIARKR